MWISLGIFLAVAAGLLRRPPDFSYTEPYEGQKMLLYGKVTEKQITHGTYGVSCTYTVKPVKVYGHAEFASGTTGTTSAFYNSEIHLQHPQKDSLQIKVNNESDLPDIGSRLWLAGSFRNFEPAYNPGNYDARVYYGAHHVVGELTDVSLAGNGIAAGNLLSMLREALWQVRQAGSAALTEALGEKNASVMRAMLLGERESLDGDIRRLYSDAGIMHILAISGLHVSMIGMGLYKLLRRIRIPNRGACAVTILFLLLYAVMTGMGVSAVRAILMFAIRLGADMCGRTYDLPTALAVSAAILAVAEPYYLLQAGFWLSFGAVAGICALGKRLELPSVLPEGFERDPVPVFPRVVNTVKDIVSMLFRGHNKFFIKTNPGYGISFPSSSAFGKMTFFNDKAGKGQSITSKFRHRIFKAEKQFRDSIAVTLSIFFLSLPIQLFFFYRINLYTPIVNLLLLPLVGVLIACAVFATVMYFLHPLLAVPGAWAVNVILTIFEKVCRLAGKLPYGTWTPGCPQKWVIVVYGLGLIGLTVFASYRENALRRVIAAYRKRVMNREKTTQQTAGRANERTTDQTNGQATNQTNGKATDRTNEQTGGKADEQATNQTNGQTTEICSQNNYPGDEQYMKDKKDYTEYLIRKTVLGLLIGLALFVAIAAGGGGQTGHWLHWSGLRITMIDVDQGDAILIRMPDGGNYLVDGGSTGRNKVGKYRIAPYLKYCGITELNVVFVTHPDRDHISGIEELLQEKEVRIGALAVPKVMAGEEGYARLFELAEEAAIPVFLMSDGTHLNNTPFYCIGPPDSGQMSGGNMDTNGNSLILYMKYGAFSMLLTGDVGGEYEDRLVQRLQSSGIGDVTLLKVAHHGSRNSTSDDFLAVVRPQIALISCGRENRYGHPHNETMNRLHARGTLVLRTDESGAISVTVRGKRVRAVTYIK